MKTYQIFIKTEKGWQYYSKTPIYAQAIVVQHNLEEKGHEVKIRRTDGYGEE